MKDICSNGISEIENKIKKVKQATQISCEKNGIYGPDTICLFKMSYRNVFLNQYRIYKYI